MDLTCKFGETSNQYKIANATLLNFSFDFTNLGRKKLLHTKKSRSISKGEGIKKKDRKSY